MKKLMSVLITIFIVLQVTQVTSGATNTSCYKKTEVVKFSGGTRTVNSVWTNLNDPTMRVETVLAKHQVGLADSLENIAKSADDEDSNVLAAINGSFFNAYSDLQPAGTLQLQGETVHVANSGSVFGIDGANNVSIDPVYVKIEGSINNSWEWPNNWEAWNLNHLFSDTQSCAIFTPAYGAKTPVHTMTAIVVNQNVVTQIVKGQTSIPTNGFVIVTGLASEINKFQIGYPVDYRVKYFENIYAENDHTSTELEWDTIRSGVGAGPTLLIDSEIVVDPNNEGFKEPKILENRAVRSFIGVTPDNMLVMGVVNNVNVYELAEIALNMGLKDAMNLDGGGSSSLYYGNAYVVKPGRALSNAIVIKQLQKRPIRVFLNTKELFFDAEPFVDTAKRTMVPMRKLFEAIGAVVTYDSATKQIIASKDDKIIKLVVSSSVAEVNGLEVILESPVILKNNRALVPLRFVIEQFGGTVTWQAETNSIDLSMSTEASEVQIEEDLLQKAKAAVDDGEGELAITLYQEVLAKDPENLDALRAIAGVCNKLLKYKDAANYYEQALVIEPKNFDLWGSIGWTYASMAELEKAKTAFNMQITLNSKHISGYYGLGQVYAHYQIQDVAKAKENFTIALTLNPTSGQKSYMDKYMREH